MRDFVAKSAALAALGKIALKAIFGACLLTLAAIAAPQDVDEESNTSVQYLPERANPAQMPPAQIPTESIIHLQNITPESILSAPIYIGQKVPITYRAIFFNHASLNQSSFKEKTTNDKIVLENPNEPWQKISEDGVSEEGVSESTRAQNMAIANQFVVLSGQKTYEITYIFKITAKSARIPAFEVSALSSDGSYVDSATSEPINLEANDLYQNKNYVGVIADDLALGIYKAKPYDEHNNLLAFEITASGANLEDFKLPNVEKQGIERSNFGGAKSSAIFYAILPRSIQNLNFEYFSLSTNRFEQIRIPVIPTTQSVATQENLKPKNTYLMYWTLFIVGVIVTLVLLSFFAKRLRKILWVLSAIIFCYLLYYLFYTKTATLAPKTNIWILPTHNSTLLETISKPIDIKIIGEHGQYYKIITPDEKIGWIRKDDAK
ncbi:hypothetical protein BKN38_06490 [Helicobacter sp. CLO-3]|uniref:hypothetical protein n=1 Tax=unclassified Helicobacter TaxID=2593540 RepID=UPI00080568FD|nr:MULTISPECIES: hypothetical protein [unclassified Helicobacter]OBV30063.1 hypothetical protein BA723_02970 [Helicobacter sp. CLO-3]OHU82702.1 hypothetical protein BKN38_06490 [Helicobacter sp. CLO-3]